MVVIQLMTIKYTVIHVMEHFTYMTWPTSYLLCLNYLHMQDDNLFDILTYLLTTYIIHARHAMDILEYD